MRVYQGLHSWLDIGGGIAVAGLGYGIAEMLVIKQKNIIYREDERSRQAIYASIGLLLCLMIWFLVPIHRKFTRFSMGFTVLSS